MLKIMITFMSTALFSASVFAVAPSQVDFSKINLTGMQVLDSRGENSFPYKLKLVANPKVAVVQQLESESSSKMVSPLFELDETSAFKNIYVYIGLTEDDTYELVEAFVNTNSIFVVDMDIMNVEKKSMDLEHGPSDERESYKVISSKGDLFTK